MELKCSKAVVQKSNAILITKKQYYNDSKFNSTFICMQIILASKLQWELITRQIQA